MVLVSFAVPSVSSCSALITTSGVLSVAVAGEGFDVGNDCEKPVCEESLSSFSILIATLGIVGSVAIVLRFDVILWDACCVLGSCFIILFARCGAWNRSSCFRFNAGGELSAVEK